MSASATDALAGTEASAALLEKVRILLERNEVEVRGVIPTRDGREHHLFRLELENGEVRLLKVPREDRMPDPRWPGRSARRALAAEGFALHLMREVPVPGSYLYLEGDPPGAIMSIVPGTTPEVLYERGSLDRALLTAVMEEMGRTLAAIHRVRPGDDPGPIPFLIGATPDDAVLLHLDYHLGNVLGKRQIRPPWTLMGVVDWTRCAWGAPEEDLAELGSSVFATNPWALDPFLSGYRLGGGPPLRRDRIFAVMADDLARRLREEPPSSSEIKAIWHARYSEWGGEDRF